MENKNIIIRMLKESDIDQINIFHNRIYNDDRTREMFAWEFLNAPAGKAIYVVAEDTVSSRIVGTQTAIPIYLKKGDGQLILSAKSEDTLVDPEYRGMQIFEKMYDLLFEVCKKNAINYIWGFTPALKPFKKIGFEAPFSHHQSLIVNKIQASYNYISSLNPKNTYVDKFKIYLMTIFSRVSQLKRIFSGSAISPYRLEVSLSVENDLDALLLPGDSKYSDLFQIHTDKSYIKWRINDNPNHTEVLSYNFYLDNGLVANIIFNHHKENVWYLIQALFKQNISIKSKSKIVRQALDNLAKNKNAALIRAWNFDTNELNKIEISIYKKAGMFYLARGVFFVWKDLKGSKELIPQNFILSRMASQGVI